MRPFHSPGLLLVAALAACSGGSDNANQATAAGNGGAPASGAQPGDAKVAQLVANNQELERLNRVAGNSGIGDVLNGVGPYTLFAPTNAAFEGLGAERADALATEQMRPQAAALLRAHIVPGTVTRRDLEAALGNAGGNPVRMKTMAGNSLTFSRDGGAIVVASEDGARARLTGEEGLGGNGAVQPIDGLLRRAQ
jgi:uncharacterized surface protein with fasciclin (FAS1) repeats